MRPSTTAFGIPELLEMVLDHATIKDLLLWQRVNKVWQETIRSSPRIQERLHFRLRGTCKTVTGWKWLVGNPFLKRFENKGLWAGGMFSHDAFDGKKASHPTASWRQMHLTSPAMTDLEAILVPGWNGRWVEGLPTVLTVVFRITCVTGITIGQLADTLKEHVACQRAAGKDAKTLLYMFQVPNL